MPSPVVAVVVAEEAAEAAEALAVVVVAAGSVAVVVGLPAARAGRPAARRHSADRAAELERVPARPAVEVRDQALVARGDREPAQERRAWARDRELAQERRA